MSGTKRKIEELYPNKSEFKINQYSRITYLINPESYLNSPICKEKIDEYLNQFKDKFNSTYFNFRWTETFLEVSWRWDNINKLDNFLYTFLFNFPLIVIVKIKNLYVCDMIEFTEYSYNGTDYTLYGYNYPKNKSLLSVTNIVDQYMRGGSKSKFKTSKTRKTRSIKRKRRTPKQKKHFIKRSKN